MSDVPERMAHLPRRGKYVVGYMFGIDTNGVPDFTVLDPDKLIDCIVRRKCGLCGQPLSYWIAFVGGSRSCDNRAFSDPAMHEECARYALSVCPFLLGRVNYTDRPARAGLERSDEPLVRSERTALYICREYNTGSHYLHASPAKRIEWFDHSSRGLVDGASVVDDSPVTDTDRLETP